VPVPVHASADPAVMAYREIEGRPLDVAELPERSMLPERLGRSLYDLHMVPLEFLGLRGTAPSARRDGWARRLETFRAQVFPLLETGERTRAADMFDRFMGDERNFRFPDAFVHGDLGPHHVLVTSAGDLAGIIDWGDAVPGDPAIDFSWLLYHGQEIGERALGAYGGAPDPGFRGRAKFYDALGPWHEVSHGLQADRPDFVRSGLEGVRERLG
jgi:aminoglycoside phosphotransferase (APT) family kinase protein